MNKEVVLMNASCEIINVIDWFRAVKLIMNGKAIKSYNCSTLYEITTTSGIYRLPNSITLIKYIRIPYRKVSLTRQNIFLRDNYTCQYCGERSLKKMTLDHVLPRSRNGENTWEYLVTSCKKCNVRKSNRTPDEAKMFLLRKPERLKKDISFADVERILQGETDENE